MAAAEATNYLRTCEDFFPRLCPLQSTPPPHKLLATATLRNALGAIIMKMTIWTLGLVLLGGTIMTLSLATAAEVTGPTSFGKTANGEEVQVFTLKNKNGIAAKVMTRGATLIELQVPDKAGKLGNVVLGFDDMAGYESSRNQFFGCTTGRVCNRIANSRFTLDGVEYKLAANDGKNHLHGGTKKTLDRVVWKAEADKTSKDAAVKFSYTSP